MPGRNNRPNLVVVRNSNQDRRAGLDWLSTADDIVVACRATGHAWPKLLPGKVGDAIHAVPTEGGRVELIFDCLDGCGVSRRQITKPGGRLDEEAHYYYTYPEGYHSPKGSDLNRRDAFREGYRRIQEELFAREGVRAAQARPTTTRRRPARTPVPAVTFNAGG